MESVEQVRGKSIERRSGKKRARVQIKIKSRFLPAGPESSIAPASQAIVGARNDMARRAPPQSKSGGISRLRSGQEPPHSKAGWKPALPEDDTAERRLTGTEPTATAGRCSAPRPAGSWRYQRNGVRVCESGSRGRVPQIHPGREKRDSRARILSRRRWWRPPAKGVSRKTARISRAASAEMRRAPRVRTLALLCSRLLRAVARS